MVTNVEIGSLLWRDKTFSFHSAAAVMAQKDINSNNTILSNYELQLHIRDGKCTADVVMKR